MAGKSSATASALSELSSQLASAVERAGSSIVAIHARRRIPSSGIIWRDGIVVSASHTVKRDDEFNVTLPDGTSTTAVIAGRDPATDLIALRVPAAKQAASFADPGAARVGSLVLAVGRPGRSVTASFGIISAIGDSWRTWQGTRVDRMLRLDVAIYDGFSGGPLVDAAANVIGVNNSALARGAAMALPAAAVDRVLDELLERGHVRRPFIGVAIQPIALSATLAKQVGQESALLVTALAEGSPADKASLVVGDVLLAANGTALRRSTDLLDVLAASRAGESVKLEILRGGARKSVSVTPDDRGGRE
jgi:S1-C subfamily serine protease